ncbi:hypothetical protein OIV83_003902 [Microbotryomycetes sp. JL201]|nr:hypothetical protein OIV83_003902 [Microbotryomycetes sp. JL201]
MPATIKIGNKVYPRPGYGAMGLSSFYGTIDREKAKETLRHAIESGVTIWNTASMYGEGDNERLIGEVLANAEEREKIFVISKWGITWEDGYNVDGSPEYFHQAINASIQRLGFTPDAYLLHRMDKTRPIEDSVRAMDEARQAGKTRFIGLSECSLKTLERAVGVAKIDFIEMEYSPWTLDIERNGVLALAKKLNIIVLAYSPLGRGFLTGKVNLADLEANDLRHTIPRVHADVFEHNMKLVEEFDKVSKEKGCQTSQIVLAWLMAQGDNVVPIPGTTSPQRVDENFASREIVLSADDENRIRNIINNNRPKGERVAAEHAHFFDQD